MTETQTCQKCGNTGFVPPFFETCDCPAATRLNFTATVAFGVDPAAATGHVEWVKKDADGAWVPTSPPANADELMEKARSKTFKGSPHGVAPTLAEVDAAVAAMEAAAPADEPDATSMDDTPAPPPFKVMTDAQRTLMTNLIAQRDATHPIVKAAQIMLDKTDWVKAKDASKAIDQLMLVTKKPGAVDERSNSYKGVCKSCGGAVDANAGVIRKVDGKWTTFHKTGDCLSAEQKAAMEATKVTEPGLYRFQPADGGTKVYRVKWNGSKTRLYGELVVPPVITDGVQVQPVGFAYDGTIVTFLRCTDKLTWAEAREFGAAYGSCIACGKSLSDPSSLVQGYGKKCAEHYHWPTVTKKTAEAIIAETMTWEQAIAGWTAATS